MPPIVLATCQERPTSSGFGQLQLHCATEAISFKEGQFTAFTISGTESGLRPQ